MKHRTLFKAAAITLVFILSINLLIMTAFADDTDYTDTFFDIMYNDMLKVSYESTASIKNNSSWEFIEPLINDEFSNGIAQFFDPVDIKALAESIVDLDGTMNADCNVSNDYDKIQLRAAFTLNKPIVINENLSIAANADFEIYMDADFSDVKNPVYKIIMKNPMINKKYIYMDYSEILNETISRLSDSNITEEAVYSALKAYIKGLVDASKASLKKNSSVTYSDNTYTMKMTDSGFKSFIFDIADTILSSADFMSLIAPQSDTNDNLTEHLRNEIDILKSAANKITILGENGYTVSYKLDSNGKPSEITSAIDISINIYDIANAFGNTYIADKLSAAGRDKCEISITAKESYKLSNTANPVVINYPALTDENSTDMTKMMNPQTNEYDYTYVKTYFCGSYDGYRIERDGETYIPARAFAESCDYANVMFNDGIITIACRDDGNAVLPFKTLSFYENGNSVFIDGQELLIEHPTFEIDGTAYIPLCALKLMDIDMVLTTNQTFYPNTNETVVSTTFDGIISK